MTNEPLAGYPEQSQSVTILVLGILSIVLCQILGPFAWKMGNDEMRAISEGRRPADGQPMAQAGKICGIIGTVLLGVTVLAILMVLFLVTIGIISASEFNGVRT